VIVGVAAAATDEDGTGATIGTGVGVNVARIIDGHPDGHPAIIDHDRTVTYGELRSQVARARGGLAALGVGRDDRVAIIAANGVPFVVTYLAALGLGAAVVPLNPGSPPAELSDELAVVAPMAVVVDAGAARAWVGVDAPAVRHVVTVAAGAIVGATSWDDLLAAEPVDDAIDVAPEHLAVLMFTSGTAGAPRAAMLTHGNLLANQRQVLAVPGTVRADDVVYGVLPLYHIFGLNVSLGLTLAVGGTLVLEDQFDPARAVETIRRCAVTAVPGVPSMWAAIAELPDAPADAFASVRRGSSGAARLPLAVAERVEERFGLALSEGYGLTEAAPIVTTSAGLEARFGSVGRVLEGIELRVVDDDGEDVLVGDAGEIWIRGDNVFVGYLDDPEATARVLDADGWLHTGDIALITEEGWLYLVDRAKDLVIVSGFNVYPAEVEEVLAAHPGVAEVGVAGVPDDRTGEAVKAYVVLEPGATLAPEALIEHARDHLARYKCPSAVAFVDRLPRNAAGKLVRRELTDDLLRA
jgi:long-chain acyl-CoA synthetase